MEHVVDFPQLWESEFVGDWREDFCNSEQSFSFGSELGIWKGPFKVSSLKPYFGSLLEGLEVSPGSAFHGLPGEVMGSKGFFSYGKEGV